MFSADLGVNQVASNPPATDPPFQKVALLLHGDGTNGAQNNTFVDYSYPGGYAVSFDGSGDKVTAASFPAIGTTTDFSIEFWYYGTNAGALHGIFDVNGYASGILVRCTPATTNGIEIYMKGSYISSGNVISNNTWYYIVIQRISGTTKIYLNGTQVASSAALSGKSVSTGTATIGLATHSTTEYLTGFLSNLRVIVGSVAYPSGTLTVPMAPLPSVTNTQLLTCQSATIVDNSPNALTMTAFGDAAAVASKTITRTGNVAQGTFSPFSLAEGQWSNYFDGTGDYLNTSASSAFAFGTGDFTVEAWIYKTANATESTILSNLESGSDGNNALMIGVNSSNAVYTSTWLTRLSTSSTNVVSNNTWTHIVFCRSGTSAAVFVNGTRVSSFTLTNDFSRTTAYKVGAYIYSGSAAGVITGYISNARVVKGTAVYDPTASTITVPTSALTAVSGTSLLTCQSNRFIDNSSNNFTITRNGDTKVTAWSPFAPSAAYNAGTNGGSGYFDGSGDYLSSTSITLTGDYTLECWFYQNAKSPQYVPIFSANTGTYNFPLIIDFGGSGYVGFYLVGGVPNSNSGAKVFDLNCWNHVAVVRSGTNYYAYVNGVRVISTTNTATSLTVDKYGGWNGSTDYQLKGFVSDARITNTAIYTGSTYTVPTAPLTAVSGTQLLLNCVNAGIYDNSGKNDIETVGNAQISTSVKKYGTGSISFGNVQGNYIRNQSSELFAYGTGDFTIEFWVYLTTTSGSAAILFDQRTTDPQVVPTIYHASNTIYYHVSGATRISGSFSTANTWVHVAVCRSSGSTKMFVNGTQVGSTYTDTNNYIASPVYCGGRWDTNGPVPGYMDDIRVTKGQALYTSNFTPPTQAFPDY